MRVFALTWQKGTITEALLKLIHSVKNHTEFSRIFDFICGPRKAPDPLLLLSSWETGAVIVNTNTY